jgi:hypothetical protein
MSEKIKSGNYTADDILDWYDTHTSPIRLNAIKKQPKENFDDIVEYEEDGTIYEIGTDDGVSVILNQKKNPKIFGVDIPTATIGGIKVKQQLNTVGDIAKKTPGFLGDALNPVNLAKGVNKGVKNAFGLVDELTGGAVTKLDNYLVENFSNTIGKKIEYENPQTAGAMTGEIIGQYVITDLLLRRAFPVFNKNMVTGLAADATTVGLFSSADEGNLASLIDLVVPESEDPGAIAKVISRLKPDADDSEIQGRLKNVIADTGALGAVISLFKIAKGLITNPKVTNDLVQAQSAGAAATPKEAPTPVEVVDSAGFKLDENLQYKQNQGLPKNIKTREDLLNLQNTIEDITIEGDAGKFWYEKSGQKILQAAQGDKDEAEKIIKLIALYSPNAAPTPNTAAALKAYYQFLDGKPINAGMTALDKKAEALLYEGKNFSGYKVNNFYNNLMMEVDPSKVNINAITTDRWILRAFGYETTGNPTQPQINFIEKTINEIAEKRSMTPYQVQAAIWASVRAGRDPEKIAALAGDDFELAINKNLGQISWETAPGVKYNIFPEYQSADPLIKAEYHFDLTKAITDDNGVDLIAKRLGLITPGQFDKPGVYQNSLGELEFNPGTQTEFVAPVATGSGNVKLKGGFEARSEIDPSAKEVIEAYAYIKGKLLNQEAVAYHRPVYNAQKDLSNGIEVKYQLNDDELKNLTKALNDEFSEFPGFVIPIGTPDGFRLIINPDITGYSIKDFQIKSYQAINKIIDVQDEQVVAFSTNTGYIDIDGYQLEKLKSGTEGSSDLYRKIPDILSELEPRVEEVYKKYETEYGWTRPTIQ